MAKIGKKALSIIISVVLVVGIVGIGLLFGLTATPRSSVLKVYNWEDYIDESLVKKFETEYRKASGDKRFKVEYRTFTDNEELYTKIKTQKADYDLAFPSEYMVEKMYQDNLLKEIDLTRIDNRVNLDAGIIQNTDAYAKVADKDDAVWAIPYMVGTLGIMYNTDVIAAMGKQTVAEFEAMLDEFGWGVLFGQKNDTYDSTEYYGHITMKKSARDTIGIAMLYSQKDNNDQYFNDLEDILNMRGDYTLSMAKEVLEKQAREMKPKYENDSGKMAFADNDHDLAYGLYWSCDAGLVMWDEDDKIHQNIKFYIPDGTNLWTDNFVMPKYGTADKKTEDAAYAFINFMLDVENAKANIEYVGSTMAVTDAMDELRQEWLADWQDADKTWINNYLDCTFPNETATEHSAIMHNFDSVLENQVNDLMINIMLQASQMDEEEGGTNWFLIVLGIVAAAAVAGGLIYYFTHRRRAK